MKLGHHTAVSMMVSGILYMIFKSWGLAIASFVSGIFIDLDHIIDYLIQHGLRFDVKKFFHMFCEKQFQRLFLILHGWEWLIILVAAAKLTDWNPWVTGVLIGYGQHMVLDALYNSPTLWSYSLLWRWKNKFDSEVVCPKRERDLKIYN